MLHCDDNWPRSRNQPRSATMKNLAKVKQDQAIAARHAVLNGMVFSIASFDVQPGAPDWRSPSFSLQVYISSATANSINEVKFLLNDLQPKLRTIARENDISIEFVEMSHVCRLINGPIKRCQMLTLALREIDRCRRSSMATFFLLLQSNKLGFCPLPSEISRDNFENRIATMSPKMQAVANQWYFLDENYLPNGHYSLRSNTNKFSPIYENNAEDQMSLITTEFAGTVFGDGLQIGSSFASLEVKTAARLGEDKTRLLWIIADTRQNDIVLSTTEEVSSNEDHKRDELLSWMYQEAFLPHLIQKFPRCSLKNNRTDIDSSNYDTFQQFSTSYFESILTDIHEVKKSWDIDGLGQGIPGTILSEIIYHYQIAAEHCRLFYCREELIRCSIEKIDFNFHDPAYFSRNEVASTNKSNYAVVSLCIFGESGVGKTALISKLCERTQLEQDASLLQLSLPLNSCRIPVIIRFCGLLSKGSTSNQLIASLCLQIHYLQGDVQQLKNLSTLKYGHLVEHFHRLLHSFPVILFLDSLDCVYDDCYSQNDFEFLRFMNPSPHPSTRIIVSITQSESKIHPNRQRCKKALLDARRPFISIDELNLEESCAILKLMLSTKSRTLTTAQWMVVKTAVLSAGCRNSILYLHLVIQVVQYWTSETPLSDCIIADNAESIVVQILNHLETELGIPAAVIKAACLFILLSVEGITDLEMVDLLSLDEEVIQFCISQLEGSFDECDVNQLLLYSWRQLRVEFDKSQLFIKHPNNCFTWRHRDISEIIERYYGNTSDISYSHCIMARYFGNSVDPEILSLRQISSQPILLNKLPVHDSNDNIFGSVWCNSAVINRRRFIEASHHMIEGNMLLEAKLELCSLESICARAKLGIMSHVKKQFIHLISRYSMSKDTTMKNELKQFNHWVNRNWVAICSHPCVQICFTASEQPRDYIAYRLGKEMLGKFRLASFLNNHVRNIDDITTVDYIVTTSQIGGRETCGPLFMQFEGHSLEVLAVCLSHDNSMIASASRDKSIILWDIVSGRCVRTFNDHASDVTAVIITPDDTLLISASRDRTIKVWLLHSGLLLESLRGHTCAIFALAITPDGSTIVSGSEDTTIKMWNLKSCALSNTLDGLHSTGILTVAVAPDGTTVASGAKDGIIQIWSLITHQIIFTLAGHFGPVRSLSISQNGSSIVSGSEDKTVRVWDLKSGEIIIRIDDHKSAVIAVAITKDGSKVISGSIKEPIKIWDVTTGTTSNLHGGFVSKASSLILSRDESFFISSSYDHSVSMWKSKILEESFASSIKSIPLIGHRMAVTCVRISANGQLLISASKDRTINIWNLSSGDLFVSLKGHSDEVTSLSLSQDDRTLVSGSKDNSVRIWNLQQHNENNANGMIIASNVAVLTGHHGAVETVAVSGDGITVVSGSNDFTLIIWNVISRSRVFTIDEHHDRIIAVDITRDGLTAVSASNHIINIWSVDNRSLLKSLQDITISVSVVLISPNGHFFCTADQFCDTIRCWHLPSGELRKVMSNGQLSYLHSIVYSEDSSAIIWRGGGSSSSIVAWDSESGNQRYSFTMGLHASAAFCSISLSLDGMVLALAHNDTIKIVSLQK